MIKNERQYRITKAQADKFDRALQAARQIATNVHPLLRTAREQALASQLHDLRQQLQEYDALRTGITPVLEIDSLAALPQALIKARIASGLSQKDLAERLDLKEQQVQRYEATDYESASFSRLLEVCQALGIQIRQDLLIQAPNITVRRIRERLQEAGLGKDFIARLLPTNAGESHALKTLQTIRRIFGWGPDVFLGSTALQPAWAMVGSARFKLPQNASQQESYTYAMYALHLCRLVLQASPFTPVGVIPENPSQLREQMLHETQGTLSLRGALFYLWKRGIPVLPLDDAGTFHGACWRIGGRNIIVLKQRTKSSARWLHDLLHELYHALQEPALAERTVLEPDEMAEERKTSPEERNAMRFAGAVVLNGRAEELAQQSVAVAKNEIRYLKRAVQQVASQEQVPVDALANYLAFRLALQGEDWWGTANNLQQQDNDPWEDARDVLLQQINLTLLTDEDRELLVQALQRRYGDAGTR